MVQTYGRGRRGQFDRGHNDVRTSCAAEVLRLLKKDGGFVPLIRIAATFRRRRLWWDAAAIVAALDRLRAAGLVEQLPTRPPRYATA